MYLHSLSLQHFRNYAQQRVEFAAAKTILVGDNAQGKSNLLESVAFLATLGSPRASSDRDLVRGGEDLAQIDAEIERNGARSSLQAILRRSGRRTVRANGETCRRHIDFLGALNTVEFSCIDIELVRGAPDYRRRWIDRLIVQLEPIYIYILREYARILKQRNAALRKLKGDRHHPIAVTLPALNVQLAAAGTKVIRRRRRALDRLAPLARRWHHAIGGESEDLKIVYRSQVAEAASADDSKVIQQALLDRLGGNQSAEYARGSTLVGPHRDEIELTIDERPARHFGSQGQQRTLVLATKLAELEAIEDVVGEPPLLLLDDVLAELDLTRQNHLLEAIEDRFQTLIATPHLNAFDAQWLNRSQILTVRAGQISTPPQTQLPVRTVAIQSRP
ncbi:MAG: DNA replication/repair protein RecF [Geitlerinemataceae cyanobacterium]